MLRMQCDRCGGVFSVYHRQVLDKSGDRVEINALMLGHYNLDNGVEYEYANHPDYNYELCPDCMDQLIAWMEEPKITKVSIEKEGADAKNSED